jgi:protoporphyrinogen IX oxidase
MSETTVQSSPARRAAISLAVTVVIAGALVLALGDGAYLWIKAVHVIAVIAWMAGMLYLPRLFVYHADTQVGSAQSETFKVMEARLLNIITTPAMIVTWVLGLWLAWRSGFWTAGWLHAKFALVLALSGLHGYLSAATRAFREDRNTKPARHWRIINEVPTVLMMGIVILVIVKPF